MVLLVAMAVVASLGAPTGWALWLVPVHMFRQLRQAYRLGWFGALWQTATLLIVAFISLSLFALALVALGLLGRSIAGCQVMGAAVPLHAGSTLSNRCEKHQTP